MAILRLWLDKNAGAQTFVTFFSAFAEGAPVPRAAGALQGPPRGIGRRVDPWSSSLNRAGGHSRQPRAHKETALPIANLRRLAYQRDEQGFSSVKVGHGYPEKIVELEGFYPTRADAGKLRLPEISRS